MRRNYEQLSEWEISQISILIKHGKSLNNIAETLSKPKTTIYYHFRKIKGKTFNPVVPNIENKEMIGEFIGLFAGDGGIYKTKDYKYRTYLYFNISDKTFVENLIDNVLVKVFGKEPMRFVQQNRLNLCYYSKNAHELIHEYLDWDKDHRKTYSVRLRNTKQPRQFKIGFIRGSLDSDGHFSKQKINFASVSPGLIMNISRFLKDFNINHSVRKYKEKRTNRRDIFHINILRRDHCKFIALIKPRNNVKYGD